MILYAIIVVFILIVIIYKTKPKKRDIDFYELGAQYDYAGQPEKAVINYRKAIKIIEPKNEDFIITKIRNRIQYNYPEVDEVQLPVLMLISEIPQKIIPIKIKEKQIWHLDTQNVHDSQLNNTIETQYQQLKQTNQTQQKRNIELNLIVEDLKTVPELHNNTFKMLEYLQFHGTECVTKLNNDTECDLVKEVWKQMSLTDDHKRAFAMGLADCYQNDGHPVCITGRVARIISSMAHMIDNDPHLGILKTHETMRNEIFAAAAKIADEDCDDDTKRIKISEMIDTYKDKYTELEKIKEECFAGIL